MDTNNLDKWWYGLPENTRQAIGNDGIWEKTGYAVPFGATPVFPA